MSSIPGESRCCKVEKSKLGIANVKTVAAILCTCRIGVYGAHVKAPCRKDIADNYGSCHVSMPCSKCHVLYSKMGACKCDSTCHTGVALPEPIALIPTCHTGVALPEPIALIPTPVSVLP